MKQLLYRKKIVSNTNPGARGYLAFRVGNRRLSIHGSPRRSPRLSEPHTLALFLLSIIHLEEAHNLFIFHACFFRNRFLVL